jgi:hypothetical protein
LQNIPPTFESIEPVPLSPVEDMFWSVEEGFEGAFRGTIVVHLNGCIEADVLVLALRQLQHRHPKLRAAIAQGSDGRRRYVFDPAAPPIPFRIEDYEGADPRWREETRRLLQIKFPAAGPLVAIGVLRNRSAGRCELLVAVHHAIADGVSAITIVNDLLSAYADAEAHLDVPAGPVLPIVTAARAPSSGGTRGRLWLLRRFLRIQWQERRSPATNLPRVRDIPPQSQWVHWTFSREETLALVRRCRKERTSLSGVLASAMCCGLMECLPIPKATFKCQFPFSIREMLEGPAGPVTPEDLGCFVSIMNESYTMLPRPAFWELARRAHTDLQAFVRHGGPALYHNLATAIVGRLLVRAAASMPVWKEERPTLFVTHYGVANIRDAYGSLRPERSTLIFKNDVIGPLLVMEGLVMGHRLNVGVAADGLEPAFWERLQVAVRRYLVDASGPKEGV